MKEAERVPVLMYHRVAEPKNSWEARYGVAPKNFKEQVHALVHAGYRAVGIDSLIAWLDGGTPLPDGSIVVTFDDGFRSVREFAQPVLSEVGWPFTVFLVSDLIGGQDVWTRDENPAGVSYPLLGADEIVGMLKDGVSFHSHTRSHPSLPTLGDEALADQLKGSQAALRQLLGCDVSYLAYPYGHADARVQAAARSAGYRAAFSTRSGFNRRDVDRFQIRRIDVFGTDTPAMLLRKMRLGTNDGSVAHMTRYYVDRVVNRLGLGFREVPR